MFARRVCIFSFLTLSFSASALPSLSFFYTIRCGYRIIFYVAAFIAAIDPDRFLSSQLFSSIGFK